MRKVLLAIALSVGICFSLSTATGCGSASAVQTEYRALGATVQLRDAAMKSWAAYYVQQAPNGVGTGAAELEARAAQVKEADRKYLAALQVFRGTVVIAYSDPTATPQSVADAVAKLLDLLRKFGVNV